VDRLSPPPSELAVVPPGKHKRRRTDGRSTKSCDPWLAVVREENRSPTFEATKPSSVTRPPRNAGAAGCQRLPCSGHFLFCFCRR
jgi:hypothetical protein